jgi:hypothetical protein
MKCLQCCARLVRDSRPNRARQEAMLAVIDRFQDSPKRAEILEVLSRG